MGMSWGSANNTLRKSILFKYVTLAGDGFCFKCGAEIESIDDFSIEHKDVWLHTDDPVGKFFDLDNIAFSHLSCNNVDRPEFAADANARRWKAFRNDREKRGVAYCTVCKSEKSIDDFTKNAYNENGLQSECKPCRSMKRSKKYGEVA